MALFLLIDMHCLRSTRNTAIKLTWHTIDIGFYVMSSEFVNKYMSLVSVFTTTTLNCYRNRSCYIRLSLTKLTHFYIIFIFICSVNTVTTLHVQKQSICQQPDSALHYMSKNNQSINNQTARKSLHGHNYVIIQIKAYLSTGNQIKKGGKT